MEERRSKGVFVGRKLVGGRERGGVSGWERGGVSGWKRERGVSG